jgi:hypothetical protein
VDHLQLLRVRTHEHGLTAAPSLQRRGVDEKTIRLRLVEDTTSPLTIGRAT